MINGICDYILIETTLLESVTHNGRISKKLFNKVIIPLVDKQQKELTQLKESYLRLVEGLDTHIEWCLKNESEWENTKYEQDSAHDNWCYLKAHLGELLESEKQIIKKERG